MRTSLVILSFLAAPQLAAAHGQAMGFDAGGFLFAVSAPVLGVAVPKYSMVFGQGGADHGLLWEASGGFSHHNFAASFAYYPGSGVVAGRGSYRLRLLTLQTLHKRRGNFSVPSNYEARSRLRISLGVGGFVHSHGAGPRAELRLTAFLGLPLVRFFAALAYEPDVSGTVVHAGEFSVGFEVPWEVGDGPRSNPPRMRPNEPEPRVRWLWF